MKEITYCIADKNGMHARPAGAFAGIAKRFQSKIRVFANGKEADGKRLLALMTLGAVCNTLLTVQIEGEDEVPAAQALDAFFKNGMRAPDPIEKKEE